MGRVVDAVQFEVAVAEALAQVWVKQHVPDVVQLALAEHVDPRTEVKLVVVVTQVVGW